MITPETANAVWDVLVSKAGASSHPDDREAFTNYAIGREYVQEYRFQGALGFGGKVFFRNGTGWYVYCYPEDLNRDRINTITTTNTALEKVE